MFKMYFPGMLRHYNRCGVKHPGQWRHVGLGLHSPLIDGIIKHHVQLVSAAI
jgi:hypothetical protein